MRLIVESGQKNRSCTLLPELSVPEYRMEASLLRGQELHLPEVSETEISRHYTALAGRVHGVNNGFYPLGSCTMKYNPKINDEIAAMEGFSNIHPLQPEYTAEGCLEVLKEAEEILTEITGMDAMTFQPAAGAHGEFTGLLLMHAYHTARKDSGRTKILVPDSAHGTNPASAAMVGYTIINIPSTEHGLVDLTALKAALGNDTAGLMLTNPNTLGLFDTNILEITRLVHEAGGLNYYDGANLNAVIGRARPGDMGFDIVHLNLHKTFSTPHGGGGPGSGPVGCKKNLANYLPGNRVARDGENHYLLQQEESVGRVKMFEGNFLIVLRALTYLLTLGKEGMADISGNAVLNANYMMKRLEDTFEVAYPGVCMHEFVLTLEKLKEETGVSALDMAKGIQEYGIHPPTMYFPNIVHEALMLEPTETESKETIDRAVDIMLQLYDKAQNEPERLKEAPINQPVRRLDEVTAARKPILKHSDEEHCETCVE